MCWEWSWWVWAWNWTQDPHWLLPWTRPLPRCELWYYYYSSKFTVHNTLYMQALYDKIVSTCDFEHSKPKWAELYIDRTRIVMYTQKKILSCLCSLQCVELVNQMSMMIGKINIYDIYTPCFSNLPSNMSRARYHAIFSQLTIEVAQQLVARICFWCG